MPGVGASPVNALGFVGFWQRRVFNHLWVERAWKTSMCCSRGQCSHKSLGLMAIASLCCGANGVIAVSPRLLDAAWFSGEVDSSDFQP